MMTVALKLLGSLHFIVFFCVFDLVSSLSSPIIAMSARSMAKGVGVYRKLIAKDYVALPTLLQTIEDHCTDSTAASPQRSTAVWIGTAVVLV